MFWKWSEKQPIRGCGSGIWMEIELKDWGIYQLEGLEWSPQIVRWLLSNTRCRGCGGCCDGSHYPEIDLSRRDAMRIPKKKRRGMTEMLDGSFSMKAPCVFYSDKRCAIHEAKPRVCCEYPISYHKQSPWVILVACPAGKDLIRTFAELRPDVRPILYQT
jgi:hypothetical protein